MNKTIILTSVSILIVFYLVLFSLNIKTCGETVNEFKILKIDLPQYISFEINNPTQAFMMRKLKYPPLKRKPLLVPKETKLLSRNKKVTASDMEPIIGEIYQITDGEKNGYEGLYVELGGGKQWVQIDLLKQHKIYAIAIWHYLQALIIYYDVIIQISDDPLFQKDVKTVYNNDHDNSSGLGFGKDKEYVEYYKGKLIGVKGIKGRYIRAYSSGNTLTKYNYYIEIEIFGI